MNISPSDRPTPPPPPRKRPGPLAVSAAAATRRVRKKAKKAVPAPDVPSGPTPWTEREAQAVRESARRTVLAEWRRVDLAPWEKAWKPRDRSAAAVVSGVLRDLRLDQRQSETEIVKVWNRLLDPNLAAHSQPVGLRHGTLFVAVDSNVWLDEIVRYRQAEILERLQSAFGSQVIRRISFRIG